MSEHERTCDSLSSLSNSVPLSIGAVHCLLLKTHYPTRNLGRCMILAVMSIGFAAAPGCTKSLLSADEERSQFQRYDRAREQDQPAFYTDEFGRRRPNLRGRLQARD